MANPKPSEQDAAPVISEMADLLAQQKLVAPVIENDGNF
jgi:hypothetical protein